jgi:3-phosphoshikimate 1-carboxyvinyltransferase
MRAFVSRARGLSGRVRVPGDKSISHRAVLFAALARGTTRVRGLAPGADVRSSLACTERLGIRAIRNDDGTLSLESPGRAGWVRSPGLLDCGNSGTTARLLMGMLAPVDGLRATLEGDASLGRRPMRRVATPLAAMGAKIGLSGIGSLPAEITGARLTGRAHTLDVSSAQVKTALLLAGLAAEGETWVQEPAASRDHTERLLPAFGVTLLSGPGGVGVRASELQAAEFVDVPGDPSSAAFFAVAAAIVPGASIEILSAGTNPTRTGAVDILRAMGASIAITETPAPEPLGNWRCDFKELRPTQVSGEIVPRAIDEIPILSVAAAFAAGETVFRDAGELRVKESDRIKTTVAGLRAMGADVEELPDGLVVRGGRPLKGARIDAGMDHRIAMAFAVAGLGADGETVIEGAEWADISFPGFFGELARLAGGTVRTE